MVRLTKLNRQKILDQNEGFTANTSYDSRNSSYDRQYTIKGGKLHIQESGKTSWADSRYNKEWVASICGKRVIALEKVYLKTDEKAVSLCQKFVFYCL